MLLFQQTELDKVTLDPETHLAIMLLPLSQELEINEIIKLSEVTNVSIRSVINVC